MQGLACAYVRTTCCSVDISTADRSESYESIMDADNVDNHKTN